MFPILLRPRGEGEAEESYLSVISHSVICIRQVIILSRHLLLPENILSIIQLIKLFIAPGLCPQELLVIVWRTTVCSVWLLTTSDSPGQDLTCQQWCRHGIASHTATTIDQNSDSEERSPTDRLTHKRDAKRDQKLTDAFQYYLDCGKTALKITEMIYNPICRQIPSLGDNIENAGDMVIVEWLEG